MHVIFQGDFHSMRFKKTDKGGYHELRITQENELGINTEVFNIFDDEIVNDLSLFNKGQFVTLHLNVYPRNGFFNKNVLSILNTQFDLVTGESKE